MAQHPVLNWVTKGVHYVSTTFALAITVTLLIQAFSADKARTQFYMTNSYLSSYSADNTIVSYTPVSEPIGLAKIEETYYGCLYEARVGMNSIYNCKTGTMTEYKDCLKNTTKNENKVKRLAFAIKKIMLDYATEVQSIAQLPAQVTRDTLEADLLVDSKRNQLKLDLAMQSNVVAIAILNEITKTENGKKIESCVGNVQTSLKLLSTTAVFSPATVLEELWKCTTDSLYTEPVQQFAYDKCIPYTLWPARDVMQSVYSDTLLGAYNHVLFAIIGAWLMTSFAVYTFPLFEGKATANGKPQQMFARAGRFFVAFGFIWNVVSIVIIIVRGFSAGDSWAYFPMSIQTVVVSLFFTVTASIYFGREVYELMVRYGSDSGQEQQSSYSQEKASYNEQTYDENGNPNGVARRFKAGRVYHGLNAFMRVSGASETELEPEQYIPLVVPVWSDAFFFVDALLFLGIVGLSPDVVTADIVLIVFCILSASLVNSAVGRLLYEGYICEVPESNSNLFDKFKDRTQSSIIQHMRESKANSTSAAVVIHSVQVMAFLSTITALLFSTMAFIMVVYRYGTEVPMLYVLFTSFLPQLLWVILALLIDSKFVTSASAFFSITSICFGLNVLIRASFLSLMAASLHNKYELTIGKSDSLNVLLGYVNFSP